MTWTWQEDDPIATYLVTVAIDHFRMVEEETESGLPLVSFYPEADADRLEGDFADADDIIEAFEEVFGPYPFDEYGAIVVPVDTGLALETQTRSTFGIDVAGIEQFRSHELAHQWFGDSLTPTRWSDIWLSEGFASYAEMLWFDASNPAYDIDVDAENRRDSIVGVDEEPILDPGVDRWFAEAVYQRGGADPARPAEDGRRRGLLHHPPALDGGARTPERDHRRVHRPGRGGQRPGPRRLLHRLAGGRRDPALP